MESRKGQRFMRLVCPQCSAQYEVDAAALPKSGRDVQCSSCAHTWFQRPDLPSPPPEPAPPPPRETRKVDPSVMEILRAEADREAQARKDRGQAASDRGRQLVDEPDFAAAVEAAKPDAPDPAEVAPAPKRKPRASRRELLPDIDELNTSLRAGSERRANVEDQVIAPTVSQAEIQRAAFRAGFITAIILALGLGLAYRFDDQIVRVTPEAAPYMEAYSGGIDRARLWIDTRFQGIRDEIDRLTGEVL